jgi:steroid 5-alpha reductase family enzyme
MMTSLSSAVSPTVVAAATALTRTISTGTPVQAMVALYAVSAATVVPLTWWRTGYSFSVGYGLSVAMMSLALLTTFTGNINNNMNIASLSKLVFTSPAHFVSVIALLYGLRLGAFIYIREQNVDEKKRQFAALDKTSPIKRTPLALGVSLLYTFMVSPVMFALRAATTTTTSITSPKNNIMAIMQMVFAYMAAFGMVLESVADQHKYIVKRNNANNYDDANKKFVGPTTWSYTLCRHPNYLGEILHWIGLFGTGCVTFPFNRTAVTPWICGILGLWGILSIMFGASSRLDKKQTEKYAGQVNYEEWKKSVKWSIVPFIK